MSLPINVDLVSVQKEGASVILKALVGGELVVKTLSQIDNITAEVDDEGRDVITIQSRAVTKVINYAQVVAADRVGTVTALQFSEYLALNLAEFSSIEPDVKMFCKLSRVGAPNDFNAVVDGSVTPVEFQCLAGTDVLIVQDVKTFLEGTTVFASDDFGDIDALVNGLEFEINGELITTIKTNLDFVLQGKADGHPFLASESRHLVSDQAWSPGLVVNRGSRLVMRVNDDLTAGGKLKFLEAQLSAIKIKP